MKECPFPFKQIGGDLRKISKGAVRYLGAAALLFLVLSCDYIRVENPFLHPSGGSYLTGELYMTGTIDGEAVEVDTKNAQVFIDLNDNFAESEVELLYIGNGDHSIGFGPVEELQEGVTYTVQASEQTRGTNEVYASVISTIFEKNYGYSETLAHQSGGTLTVEEKKEGYLRASFSVPTAEFDLSGNFIAESYW